MLESETLLSYVSFCELMKFWEGFPHGNKNSEIFIVKHFCIKELIFHLFFVS